jgi:hypothetical protein
MKHTQAVLLPAVGGILLILYITLSSAPFTFSREQYGDTPWQGYTRLGLEGGALSRGVADAIAALEGMEAVVSEHSATVSFNTFAGFERIPVAELGKRLENRDPRMDPYMAGLQRYFRGERSGEPLQILYLKSRRHFLSLERQLASLLTPARLRWRLSGPTALRQLFLLALFAGAALLVVAGRPRPGRVLALLSIAPWLPRVAAGGSQDLYAFLLLYPLWVPVAESARAFFHDRLVLGWRGDAGKRLLPRVLLLAAGFLLSALLFRPSGGGEGALGGAAAWYLGRANLLEKNSITLLANLLLLPLTALELRLRRARRFHDVFRPLPIRAAAREQPRRLPAAGLLLLAAVSFALLTLSSARGSLTAPWPVAPWPAAPGGSAAGQGVTGGLTWQGIAALADQSAAPLPAAGYLPDLADYLTHRAFQEGLAFGRPYRLPSPGERLTLSYYLVNPDTREVVQTRRVVKRFQSGWLEESLARAAPGDVEGLLVAQKAPVKVVSLAEHLILRRAFPPARQLLLLIYLLSAVFGADIYLTASLLYGMRKRLIRRNQHAV